MLINFACCTNAKREAKPNAAPPTKRRVQQWHSPTRKKPANVDANDCGESRGLVFKLTSPLLWDFALRANAHIAGSCPS